MQTTISIRGARENNLQNVDVEIPRDQLTVVTGVSGSGKSSLAFDTIFAEGQRRLLESMSSWAKRFVQQLKKPHFDFMMGLSPVISIDQKTITKNPRSTVGTMTDILDYLRMLYAAIGTPHCPMCEEQVTVKTLHQMAEHVMSLPEGTEVEIRAPILKIFGEDYPHLFEQIRASGYRCIRVDGKKIDLGNEYSLEEEATPLLEVIIDTIFVDKNCDKAITTSLQHGLEISDGFFSFHINSKLTKKKKNQFYQNFGCSEHNILSAKMHYGWFTFNDRSGACPTCMGLGTYKRVHPPLLIPDRSLTLREGAIIPNAINNDKNTWGGRLLESLSQAFKFSLDVPFDKLAKKHQDIIYYGTKGKKFKIVLPPGAKQGKQYVGREMTYEGVVNKINQQYAWYCKHGEASNWAEEHFEKVMVNHDCPDCSGQRLKKQRRLVTIEGKNLAEIGNLPLKELRAFIHNIPVQEKDAEVIITIQREILGRLDTLIGIGLDYLNLNRRSATLSGGESQRIRLASQIGSGLMGMLYVLDEPSIGLHPKDNQKMIATLQGLRDLGNTVIVVEHDEDTIRAADYIVEMGPGAGIHGGKLVASGTLKNILAEEESPTGNFLSKRQTISCPKQHRKGNKKWLKIQGARENNLKNVQVEIPLGTFTCITGASGSGKSSLVHEILYKKLCSLKYDSRILPGDHDNLTGADGIQDVIHIDQSPIGRTSRSNPATYIGFYDNIRKLFASTELAVKRQYTASRFSFNVKGGRCEECQGGGIITTKLAFMPDVETTCPRCKGARYNEETLEVTYKDKNIHDVLSMSIEEGVAFFEDQRLICHKLKTLNGLGLGYLDIGHSATILSGGEAQRIKLASELSKIKRGKENLYIMDEPTTGLHFADIQKLLDCLNRLVDSGHSVLVIEHNLDVIKTADYVIDLGPEGGAKGGEVLVCGTPKEIAKSRKSFTGKFLKSMLK